MIELFSLAVIALLGALIGSFANVVIYRLPLGRSVVWPGSSCPACNHRLSPLELVPVASYLAQRGRCRVCGIRIASRYPLVELLMAVGFALLAWRFPPWRFGPTVLPLLALFALLVMAAFIDLDTFELPDSLTLPAVALALFGAGVYASDAGLPGLREAALGAVVGAGIIALINRVGSLVLRRGRDTKERLWPLGFDQVNAAALVGAVAGFWPGVAAAGVSLALNAVARRPLRLPEPLLYGGWLAVLLASGAGWGMAPLQALGGSVAAAGVWALLGAVAWWLAELLQRRAGTAPEPVGDVVEAEGDADAADDEPIAMGFGDAKLAAVLGALLGWQLLLVGLFAAVTLGAVGGLVGRGFGGGRVIPFGPFLVLGGLLALFAGEGVIAWYLALLGVN